jgi:hypothetical protein
VGVGTRAGLRQAAAPFGGVVGVVVAAGDSSWPAPVACSSGQRAGRFDAGGDFAAVGVGW